MRFTVPGPPIPKARPRVVGRRAYTPEATLQYSRKVALVARTEGITATSSPVSLGVWFYMADRRRADIDNLAKAVMDGLNGIAYHDDAQVEQLFVTRMVDPSNPRAVVTVDMLDLTVMDAISGYLAGKVGVRK